MVAIPSYETLMQATAEGRLHLRPLNSRNLRLANKNGWTVAHAAAFHGHLDQVPSKLVTPALMRLSNGGGESVGSIAGLRIQLARTFAKNISHTDLRNCE